MIDALFFPSVFLYLGFPLIVLLFGGFQLKVFGTSSAGWGLVALAILWGLLYVVHPYSLTWVPSVFTANVQKPYLVIRAACVLIYCAVSIYSLLKKSLWVRTISRWGVIFLLLDLCWALGAGRYVGS